MQCQECGNRVKDNEVFCSQCGTKINPVAYKKTETIRIACKSCGGSLEGNATNPILICPFCGSKELVVESDEVKKQRIVSEAEKEVLMDQNQKNYDLLMRQMDYSQKKTSYALPLMLLILGLLMMAFGDIMAVVTDKDAWATLMGTGIFILLADAWVYIHINEKNKERDKLGRAGIPEGWFWYQGKSVEEVVLRLRNEGFTNIITMPADTLGISKKVNSVEYIAVDGVYKKIDKYRYYLPDSAVTVYYNKA